MEIKEGKRKERGVDAQLAVNVSENTNDYTCNILHSGHMDLEGMLHKRRSWGVKASKSQFEQWLQNCEVCKRHRRVNRDTKNGDYE